MKRAVLGATRRREAPGGVSEAQPRIADGRRAYPPGADSPTKKSAVAADEATRRFYRARL